MVQKVYGLTRDCGDGSNTIDWFLNEAVVDLLLSHNGGLEDWIAEAFYGNEGSPAQTLTFPDDLDLVKCGFQFADAEYTEYL